MRVATQRVGHVFVIELNRPEKKNAADMALLHELSLAFGELDRDPELRVGVVVAAGSDFTAGLDLADVAPHIQDGRLQLVADGGCDPWRMGNDPECRKPVVMGVQGLCLTLGIELAAACDIVIAAEDARFGQIEVARGILPFGGATLRLPKRIGWSAAMRWMLGAQLHTAHEALQLGLVLEVLPAEQLRPRVMEIANEIAAQAPLAVQATLQNARLAEREGDAAARAALPEALQRLLHSEDAQTAVAAYLSGQPAEFRGR
ncbi:MAG: crotonase/enoyl-CoA hydratase family protein [Agromyces sp.]